MMCYGCGVSAGEKSVFLFIGDFGLGIVKKKCGIHIQPEIKI